MSAASLTAQSKHPYLQHGPSPSGSKTDARCILRLRSSPPEVPVTPKTRNLSAHILDGLSKTFAVIAGVSFFIGALVIYATAKADRFLSELIGICVAGVCLIVAGIAKHKAEDIEWEEANEAATRESAAPQDEPKP